MTGAVFTQQGVTGAGDPYWAIDAPTIGEMGWRYIVVLTADAVHVCRVETRDGFYDRLKKLAGGAAYAEVFRSWSRWFPIATLDTLPLDSVRRLEEVPLTHTLTLVSRPEGGREKRVSVSTPGVPLYHDLFRALRGRLCEHAEVKTEVASVGQLARGPAAALAGGVLVTILLVSAWFATAAGEAPPAGGRHAGILAAVGWFVSQVGLGGVAALGAAALLAPVAWLLVRVRARPPRRVVEVEPKHS
jgi:hypothetical protein